ncbi:hypothetical protein ACS04_15060 [Streptomyces roseus]|uniref:Uncharacterized protein n=1 Tax=Streptomyces roseus TaxID=66430 RepID=A0A0J6XLR5_9ACTN|nr:hypothetical protein ACS04_15060 [Streptomyces roseus]
MLALEFPGSPELREQISFVEVVGKWGENSASIDLRVQGGVAPAPSAFSGIVPVEATVYDGYGELFGEILVWVASGYLSGIEYAWYGDSPPTSLPAKGSIVVELGTGK